MNNTMFLIKFIIGIIMCTSGIITMIFFLYKAYKIAKKPIIDERGMLIQDSYIKINKRDKNLVIKEAEGELDICDDTSFLVDYDDDTHILMNEAHEEDDTEILLDQKDSDETQILVFDNDDTEIL